MIAGGRSTRFGDEDKAVADLAGTPMVRRVADRLAPAVESLVVNCREDQRDAIAAALDGYDLPVAFALDEDPDEGPMAGIRTGLRAVESEYAFVAACDMPFIDPDLVAYLLERAEGSDAAVPRPDEWFETTHAAYRADAMADACDAALERGDRKIIAPLFDLDYVTVGAEELREQGSLDSFDSLDTRAAFHAAADRLRRQD